MSRRIRHIFVACFLATLALAACGVAAYALGVEESLGHPIQFLDAAGSTITTNRDGVPLVVTIANGDPSVLSIAEATTGKLLHHEEVEGVSQAFGFKVTPERTVYIGASGGVAFQVDPDTLTVREIGRRPFGETYLWDVDQTPDGKIWFASYPGGAILSWDPKTEQWVDRITFASDITYVRSIAAWNGLVYAGTGPRATIFEYNPATGAKREIPLPQGYEAENFVYELDAAAGKLFARVTPSNMMLVYDLATEEWVQRVPQVLSLGMPGARIIEEEPGARAVTYFVSGTTRRLMEYDLEKNSYRATPVSVSRGGGQWAWVQLSEDGQSKDVLFMMDRFGTIFQWDATNNKTASVASEVVPGRANIRSLAAGPDGLIYVGGYASNAGVAQVDPETGRVTMLSGPGQIEQFGVVGDYLYMGVYAGAKVYAWDTTKPWVWNVTTRGWTIGEAQDRPTAIIDAGRYVAVGTVPRPGELGGALALIDRETNSVTTYRHVVRDQSPLTLLYRDGLIYGGTGVWGGLGIDPTTREGKLFIFDMERREVVFETVPVRGSRNVSGLTFDDEGNIWGVTGSHIFKFDTEKREVVFSQQIINTSDAAAYWVGRSLTWYDGKLVGMTSRKAFVFDPETHQYYGIADLGISYAAGVAIDKQGRFYYSKQSELFRWTPDQWPLP